MSDPKHSAAGIFLAVAALAALNGCSRREQGATESPRAGAGAAATRPTSAPARAASAPAKAPLDARGEVGGVMDRFLAAKSYHATMTSTAAKSDMKLEMDFVAPDRYRMKTPVATQYVVGDTVYMTMNGRTTKTPFPKNKLGSYRDPAKFAERKATMSVQALGSEVVDGQPATKYLVRNTEPEPGESTMWVGADGYPLQIEVTSGAGGQTSRTTIRYSRFNDPTIRVEPPPQ